VHELVSSPPKRAVLDNLQALRAAVVEQLARSLTEARDLARARDVIISEVLDAWMPGCCSVLPAPSHLQGTAIPVAAFARFQKLLVEM
jgi:hypothetical protein